MNSPAASQSLIRSVQGITTIPKLMPNKTNIQMANPIAAGTIGAALIAGLGIGRLTGFHEFKKKVVEKAVYTPTDANREIYDTLYQGFRSAQKRLVDLYRNLNPGVY